MTKCSKWQGLPYWVAAPVLDKPITMLKEEVGRWERQSLRWPACCCPRSLNVHSAGTRQDRNINQLRTVEALRLYAAAHGKLPEKLTDITDVPIPLDPDARGNRSITGWRATTPS